LLRQKLQENFEEHNKIQQLNSTQDELKMSVDTLTDQQDSEVASQIQQLDTSFSQWLCCTCVL
jgi:hypothetical protein